MSYVSAALRRLLTERAREQAESENIQRTQELSKSKR
jgi:hypothetical protein